MGYEAVVVGIAIICFIGLPMGGLVLRFALRPLIRDLTSALQEDAREELAELRERMAAVENRLDAQDETLDRLVEVERFHRELEAGDEGS